MNKIIGSLTALALAVALCGFSGCGTFGKGTPGQSQGIAAACASIAASEDVVTAVNNAGKLNRAEYDAVAKAIAIKAPICNVSPEPTSLSAAAYQELLGAVATFTTARNKLN